MVAQSSTKCSVMGLNSGVFRAAARLFLNMVFKYFLQPPWVFLLTDMEQHQGYPFTYQHKSPAQQRKPC